jgi:hypothetical protein
MTDQHPGYREDWDITSEEGSLCFASAIYSRLVGGEQDEATLQWLAKYLRANAAPHHITVMTDQHQHHASINLNEYVKVKLTDSGQDVLAMQQLRRQQDADGYIKFQLWELMNIFGVHVYNGCSIPFEFNRILLAPFDSAMTDQHNATDERLRSAVRAQSKTVAHLSNRVEGLEKLHAAVVDLNERFNLDPLVARVEALEATQHAHIEAKAAEAGARCAVEQMRSRPGSWQPLKVETTYGSDAAIPELSEHCAPVEPEQQDKLDRLIKFGIGGWGGRASAEIDRVLALQDQIRDGSLTLAEALKKIGALEPAPSPRLSSLVDRVIHAINPSLTPIFRSDRDKARAAIREVAAWINERELKAQNDPDCLEASTADEAVGWLRNEIAAHA